MDSTQTDNLNPAPQRVDCPTNEGILEGRSDDMTSGTAGGGEGEFTHQRVHKRARDGRGWGQGNRRPPNN